MQQVTKTLGFNGTPNRGAPGDVALFRVTGRVLISEEGILPYCAADLVGDDATLSATVTGQDDYLGGPEPASNFRAGTYGLGAHRVIEDGTSGTSVLGAFGAGYVFEDTIIALQVKGAPITGGALRFDVVWAPLSAGATIVAG